VPEHVHDQLEITVLFEPASCVLTFPRGTTHTLHAPAVLMIAPHQWHACRWQKDADAVVMYVDRRLQQVHGFGHTQFASGALPQVAQDRGFWQLAGALRTFSSTADSGEVHTLHLVAETLAARALELVGRPLADSQPGMSSTLLSEVDEFINARVGHAIQGVDFANHFKKSFAHLTELFKAARGITLMEQLFRRRMEKADALLATMHFKIGEVAVQVGYDDQGHFTKKFRGYFGYSPRQAIEQARAKSANRPKNS
jgi:AraC-like DNA-binding protein